ncbi:MAG: response regulator, partial [Polaromonas sp.]|nr:response regulator [Polaromonas sp.]
MKLLYAEDNPQDADLTRSHLAEHALEIELQVVSTGAACLEQVQRSPPDLLLLDHHLSDIDGVTLLPQLLRLAPSLPVVIVTGDGDEALVVQALSLGAAHYVPKHDHYLDTLADLLPMVLTEHRLKFSQGLRARQTPQRILYVEHLPMDIDLTLRHFAEAAPHFVVDVVRTCALARTQLNQLPAYDLVLLDLQMPDQNGLDFMREAKYHVQQLPPCIVISGSGSETTALAALKLGATDYIIKRHGYLNELAGRINNAISQAQLSRAYAQLRQLSQAVEQSSESIVITDAEDRIEYVNAAFSRSSGYPREEAIGQ